MKFTLIRAFVLLSCYSLSAQQDSIVKVVFDAITTDHNQVGEPIKGLLLENYWEALAYWDIESPKTIDQMSEAVGDVYQFKVDGTFLLKMIDPDNPQQFGQEIRGSYILANKVIQLKSKTEKTLEWPIIWLDHNYLILEIGGLRIFFTKSKSYFTED